MSKQHDLNALLREHLGGTFLDGVAVRAETPGMLRVSEVAALTTAAGFRKLLENEAVPRAWLIAFVRRVEPVLREGYQNCGEDPECLWAAPMIEAQAILAALDGKEEGPDGKP